MSSTERTPVQQGRRFGVGAAIFVVLLATWIYFRKHRPVAGAVLGGVGAVFALSGLVAPMVAFRARDLWLRFAGLLGWFNSRVILTVLFFVVLTPMALLRRVFGRGEVDTRWAPGKLGSNWRPRNEPYDSTHYDSAA
jgi:hypothetical protein